MSTSEVDMTEDNVQEPVAWRVRCIDPLREWVLMYKHPTTELQFSNMEIQPLYTTSPTVATPLAAQRQWVGLTKEEIDVIRNTWGLNTCRAIQDTENLLKARNT